MKLAGMTWQDVAEWAPRTVAVLPIAAVEQHGLHLPVTTDAELVCAIAAEAEERMADSVVLCPAQSYGSSDHHLSFAGTISIGAELYTRLIQDLVRSLLRSGFRRIVLLNGHGGNSVPVKQALAALSREIPGDVHVALVTYWELGGQAFAGAAPMESPALSHACEYETSMMLHLGSAVRMERVGRAQRPPANAYVAWEDEAPARGVFVARRTEFISSNGSSGEPQLATKDKGAHLLQEAVGELVEFLRDFQQWKAMEKLADV